MELFRTEEYSGPVPPVDLIEGYQRIIPGGGERLLAMAETEGEHRRDMERRHLRASVVTHVLGQLLGFALAGGIIYAGAYLIDHGHGVPGYATVLLGAAGIVRAFFRVRA